MGHTATPSHVQSEGQAASCHAHVGAGSCRNSLQRAVLKQCVCTIVTCLRLDPHLIIEVAKVA